VHLTYDPAVDYYHVLGVDEDASNPEIEQAWRSMRRIAHPDLGGSNEAFQALKDAYDCLSAADSRQAYDQLREQYFSNLPPVLRLSTGEVNFGKVSRGDSKVHECSVQLYNDGGDAVIEMRPERGTFWVAEGGVADDPAALAQYVFTLDLTNTFEIGPHAEEVRILLDNGTEISAQRLTVKVQVATRATSGSAGTTRSGPAAGAHAGTKPTGPRPAPPPCCPRCGSRPYSYGYCPACTRRKTLVISTLAAGVIGLILINVVTARLNRKSQSQPAAQISTAETGLPNGSPVTDYNWPTLRHDVPTPQIADYLRSHPEPDPKDWTSYPDKWAACSAYHCLAGYGYKTLKLFQKEPFKFLGAFTGAGKNAYLTLLAHGLSDVQARRLLARGDSRALTAKAVPMPPDIKEAKWPTTAQDGGTPAFQALLGALFMATDWISCEAKYCLVGSEDKVIIFGLSPTEELGSIPAAVPSPYQKLRSIKFTDAQARALLQPRP